MDTVVGTVMCLMTKIDNLFYRSKLTKASNIAKLLVQRRTREISGMGYLNIDENSLHKLQYCDRTYGLNGSVPADILHTFQLGIYIYVMEGLFGERKPVLLPRKKGKEWENSVKRKNRSRIFNGAMNQIPQQLPPK
jgi:hypothetical protein